MRAFLALLLLAAPLAAAQGHTHEEGDGIAYVLRDGPMSGRAVVGGLTHFGFALLKEGEPQVHRDATFRVMQGERILFETSDTHEYDGIFSFDVVFLHPGPYRVEAESEGMTTGVFEGVVVPPANATQATVSWTPESRGTASNAIGGALAIVDADGAILQHTDALIELRRVMDQRLVARWHAHVHDDAIQFTQALDEPGSYTMHVTAFLAYPTGRAPDVVAVVAEFPVSVGPVPAPGLVTPPTAPPPVLSPEGAMASDQGFTLWGGFDPQNQVGAGQSIRLTGTFVNDTHVPVQHVDFALRVDGPQGRVFESESLHEYDGVFEYEHVPFVPGEYVASMTATFGDVALTIPFRYEVLPPVAPLFAGVGRVAVDGLDGLVVGEARELHFTVVGPQGPIAHSEVDVVIGRVGEAAAYRFKLHTHASGDTHALVTFPVEGDWRITVDPRPTFPSAVVFEGPDGPGTPIAFAASVAPGEWIVEGPMEPLAEEPRVEVPWAGAAAFAAVALAALYRRPA